MSMFEFDMDKSIKKRLYLLMSIWTATVAWHIHFYPTWAGSPIPSTFGVNQDWTRYHITQSGTIGEIDAWTIISSYMGGQNDDIGSIFLAIVNIVTGTTDLVESLVFLNTIQLAGLLLLPMIFLYWYRTANRSNIELDEVYLILILGFFPTHQTIEKAAQGWFTELIATSVFLFILAFLAKATTSRRVLAGVIVMIFIMLNLYRTWIYLFLAFFIVIYFFEVSTDRITSARHTQHLAIPTAVFLIGGGLFYLSGEYWNGNFREFFTAIIHVLFTATTQSRIAADPELVGPIGTDLLLNLNTARTLKLINGLSAVSIIFLYAGTRIRSILDNPSGLLGNIHERIVFASLLIFPFITIVFYNYRGFGSAIGRTRYIGIYFVILATALLFRDSSIRQKRIVTALSVIMVITAILAAILGGGLSPAHSLEDQHSINKVGSLLPEKSYVFSDASLGPPLGYYNIQGISIIMGQQNGWNDRMKKVYYKNSSTEAIQAMDNTIMESKISNDAPPMNGYYSFLYANTKADGVRMLVQRTKPTEIDPRVKFNNNRHSQKVYTSGKNTLFYHADTGG